MKNLVIVSLIVILTGCTAINDVSTTAQFKNQLGTKHLIRNFFLCVPRHKGMFGKGLPENELYENHGYKSCPRGTDVAMLKQGSVIEIIEVSHRSHFGVVSYTHHWYFIGSVTVEGTKVKFFYYLALTSDAEPPVDYENDLLWK